MEMQITPAFVLQSSGVTYMGKAKKVPYSEVWARVLGKLRESYPQYDFNRASNSAISLNVAVELGAYESRAKTTYVVSTVGAPTACIALPAMDDTGDVVDAVVSGIVGVLERIYPTYFNTSIPRVNLSDVLAQVEQHPEQKHPDLLATEGRGVEMFRDSGKQSKLATWPKVVTNVLADNGMDETKD